MRLRLRNPGASSPGNLRLYAAVALVHHCGSPRRVFPPFCGPEKSPGTTAVSRSYSAVETPPGSTTHQQTARLAAPPDVASRANLLSTHLGHSEGPLPVPVDECPLWG